MSSSVNQEAETADRDKALRLDSAERLAWLQPRALLRILDLPIGTVCIDMGCGPGTFALLLAELVGAEGAVYALDRSQEMLRFLLEKPRPPNLHLLLSDALHVALKGGLAHLCVLAFLLHEVQRPEVAIQEAFRLLRSGGRALILEWEAIEPPPGPPLAKRLDQGHLRSLLERIGFSILRESSWAPGCYLTLAQR